MTAPNPDVDLISAEMLLLCECKPSRGNYLKQECRNCPLRLLRRLVSITRRRDIGILDELLVRIRDNTTIHQTGQKRALRNAIAWLERLLEPIKEEA